MTDSLLREVDEELRHERYRQLWRRYRTPLLLAVAALILATAGSSLWRNHQEKKAGEAMQRLDAAIITLQRGEAELAAKHFAHLAENSSGELKDISRLWQARALAEGRNAEAAVKTLHALAENPAGDELVWRDLACLRLMAAGEESPKSCTGTGDSPLKSQRLEWHASQLWQQGEAKEARALLDKIAADETAPKAQRERARHLRRAIITKE